MRMFGAVCVSALIPAMAHAECPPRSAGAVVVGTYLSYSDAYYSAIDGQSQGVREKTKIAVALGQRGGVIWCEFDGTPSQRGHLRSVSETDANGVPVWVAVDSSAGLWKPSCTPADAREKFFRVGSFRKEEKRTSATNLITTVENRCDGDEFVSNRSTRLVTTKGTLSQTGDDFTTRFRMDGRIVNRTFSNSGQPLLVRRLEDEGHIEIGADCLSSVTSIPECGGT